jgi:hypothetical protein
MADTGRTIFGSIGGTGPTLAYHQSDPGYAATDTTPTINAGVTAFIDLDGAGNANGADAPGIDCTTETFTPEATTVGLYLYTVMGGASGPFSASLTADQHILEVQSGKTILGDDNTFVTQFLAVHWPEESLSIQYKNYGASPITDCWCELYVTQIF